MQQLYEKIIQSILDAGKRIKGRAGVIDDIGITKKYLTEEDVRIERDLKELIVGMAPDHKFCAEEENKEFINADDVWVVDPISGTSTFIAGLPHFGIVVSHVHKGETIFAAVYDPLMDELFTAYKNGGSFLNGKKFTMPQGREPLSRILVGVAYDSIDPKVSQGVFESLSDVNLFRNRNSFGVNYCHVAYGRYSGVLALEKDSFPEYAGKLIIEEAGGIFTNKDAEKNIKFSDRVFIGGNIETYKMIQEKTKEIFE